MRTNNRSQSALEYMMTYGWAILIIVIVAGVLYSLGIFNPSASAGTAVTGFSGFDIQALCIPGGAIQLSITNGVGYTVNITGINATGNGQTVAMSNAYTTLSPLQSTSYYVSGVCPSTSGSRYAVQAAIAYKEVGQTFSTTYFSTGTVSGTTSSSVTPSLAASFSKATNSSFISVPSSRSLNITGSITISAWINPRQSPGSYNYIIVSKKLTNFFSTTGGYGFELGFSTDFGFAVGPQNASAWVQNILVAPASGVWINVVAVKSASATTIYLYDNGSVRSTDSSATWPLTNTTSGLTIGKLSFASSSFFNGTMSDVQIYNTALTATQVQQLYSEGLGGAPLTGAGLEAWWPLNGNTLDYSGNGNNGVPTSITWVTG